MLANQFLKFVMILWFMFITFVRSKIRLNFKRDKALKYFVVTCLFRKKNQDSGDTTINFKQL